MLKKIAIIALVIFFVIFVAAVGLVVWQYDNINAFVYSRIYDEQDLNQMVEQSQKEVVQYLENNDIGTVRPLTEEESRALNSGEITEQQAVKIVTGQTTLQEIRDANKAQAESEQPSQQPTQQPSQNNEQSNNGQNGGTPEQQPAEPTTPPQQQPPQPDNPEPEQPSEEQPADYDTLISEKIAEMYVVKSNYYAEFNSQWSAAKEEFLARPVEEHTKENVAAVVTANMSKGLEMEKRYDEKIDTIVAELTSLLEEAGRDTQLATAVKNAYDTEKKAEKARIINKYFG